MPLKLNVGLSKKIGLPDYGSLGASCHVEVELDSNLLEHDLDGFHGRVQRVFAACRQTVHDELARNPKCTAGATSYRNDHSPPANGHQCQNGNGNGAHAASQKQLDYASQLARQIRGFGTRKLEGLATKMYRKPLAGLSSMDASGLIDTLRAIKDGQISIEQALGGVPV